MIPYNRPAGALLLAAVLAGCGDGPVDIDLRDNIGQAFSTTPAVNRAVAPRPAPDNRGVISYPTYQVVVAQRGDTVERIAQRVGLPPDELARFNGLPPAVPLRPGEIVALPRRVAEPSAATGAKVPGPVLATPPVTTTSLEDRANQAIDRAEAREPERHRVAAGETAFTIARRYGVPVESLAEWNGLDENYTVREGQYLMIPVAGPAPQPIQESAPGEGTVAPEPPSASEPLPQDDAATPEPPEETPPSPDLAQEATESSASDARFVLPVSGPIVRAYSRGRNDGIDISAAPGTPVRAADEGTVAAITRDTDQVPILVLRHAGDLLTVYAGVTDIAVERGQTVGRGQQIAAVGDGDPAILHFEVREGFESVDPVDFLP